MNQPHKKAKEIELYGKFEVKSPKIDSKLSKELASPIKLQNGETYLGSIQDNKRYGIGRCVWPDGSVYEGEWKNDRFEGQGRMIFKEGDFYTGDFIDGKATGFGVYESTDGTVYKGEMYKDQF